MRFTMLQVFAFVSCPRLPIEFAQPFAPRPRWLKEMGMTEIFPPNTVRCDACPVLCYIKRGHAGACDRYANHEGQLIRVDPHILLDRAKSQGTPLVPFLERDSPWDGQLLAQRETFVTAIGAGTTYPDYKPAPFIVSSQVEGIDMVTVVTEG